VQLGRTKFETKNQQVPNAGAPLEEWIEGTWMGHKIKDILKNDGLLEKALKQIEIEKSSH
jgi:hypothetical protein